MKIKLNSAQYECNNVIYVSTKGDDSNDGTRLSPVKTYNQAFKLAKDGDVIYLLPGVYDYFVNDVQYSGIIYDDYYSGKYVIIYGPPNAIIKINNPESPYRDIHFISLYNEKSKFIGCTVYYNVTNRYDCGNYSRSFTYYSKGNVYNTLFYIQSITSMVYCNNNSNTMAFNNCQFIISNQIEESYSGNDIIFNNCIFTGITKYEDKMKGEENIFDFDCKNTIPSKYHKYGVFYGKYRFPEHKYLFLINNILFIKNSDKFISKGNELSQSTFDEASNSLTDLYTNKDFINTVSESNYNVIKKEVFEFE